MPAPTAGSATAPTLAAVAASAPMTPAQALRAAAQAFQALGDRRRSATCTLRAVAHQVDLWLHAWLVTARGGGTPTAALTIPIELSVTAAAQREPNMGPEGCGAGRAHRADR